MKILMLISNYEREDMLKSLLNEINQSKHCIDYFIVDDHSTYDISQYTEYYYRNEYNYGKEEYWKTFKYLLDYAKASDYDQVIFSPNDFSNFDFDKIINIMEDLYNKQYIFNLINDGRNNCWNSPKMYKVNDNLFRSYFCDAGFFTNSETLSLLNIHSVPISRFKRKDISSGVGQQLTNLIKRYRITCYHPAKSLCFHGDHISTMHPLERKKNPLKSK